MLISRSWQRSGGLTAIGCMLMVGPVAACDRPHVWIEDEQTYTLDASGIEQLVSKTRNGHVHITAEPGREQIVVQATIRARGASETDAQACREAIDLIVRTEGDTATAEAAWLVDRRPKAWSAVVSFDITGPAELDVQAATRNGDVKVHGATDDCAITTRNGKVTVVGATGRCTIASRNGDVTLRGGVGMVTAETRNGRLDVDTAATELKLTTRNGGVLAAVQSPGSISGQIESRNGAVEVRLHDEAAAKIRVTSRGGAIDDRLPLRDTTRSKRSYEGEFGEGGGVLSMKTRNGDVRLAPIAGQRD